MAALVSSAGGAVERELEQRRFAAGLASLALLTGECFVALALILAWVGSESWASRGTSCLMPTAVAALLGAPSRQPVAVLFVSVHVPPHALPWALVAVAWLLGGVLPLDLVAGVAAGHLFGALLRARELAHGAARPAGAGAGAGAGRTSPAGPRGGRRGCWGCWRLRRAPTLPSRRLLRRPTSRLRLASPTATCFAKLQHGGSGGDITPVCSSLLRPQHDELVLDVAGARAPRAAMRERSQRQHVAQPQARGVAG
jgi:hypothetical protein